MIWSRVPELFVQVHCQLPRRKLRVSPLLLIYSWIASRKGGLNVMLSYAMDSSSISGFTEWTDIHGRSCSVLLRSPGRPCNNLQCRPFLQPFLVFHRGHIGRLSAAALMSSCTSGGPRSGGSGDILDELLYVSHLSQNGYGTKDGQFQLPAVIHVIAALTAAPPTLPFLYQTDATLCIFHKKTI